MRQLAAKLTHVIQERRTRTVPHYRLLQSLRASLISEYLGYTVQLRLPTWSIGMQPS